MNTTNLRAGARLERCKRKGMEQDVKASADSTATNTTAMSLIVGSALNRRPPKKVLKTVEKRARRCHIQHER